MTPARRWPLLLLVAIAARALSFGNPLVHPDEQFYFTVASAMWDGALPYLDIWDRKPLGLFLLYMPAAALPPPWGTLAYQTLALACVTATAALVARLADRAGWGRGALAAGCAYILWLNLLAGSSGQSPVFYNLPVALAAVLVATRSGRSAGLGSMALVGLALQLKPAAVFEGVFLGLWLLAAEWRARRSAPALAAYAAALAAVALLPTIAAWGFYAAQGAGDAWRQANVESVVGRLPDPLMVRLKNGLKLLLILSPLIAMGFGPRADGDPRLSRFLRLWFAVALGGVAVFGGWYDHYGLPAVVPGAACAAAFFAGAGRRYFLPVLLVAALAGQATLVANRWKRGDARALAALARAVGRGPGALWVYSDETLLYRVTGRPAVTRWRLPSHLYLARESGSIGVDQAAEVRRIFARRPELVVAGPRYRGEQPHIRALVDGALARDYRPVARVAVGSGWAVVHRRRASTAP